MKICIFKKYLLFLCIFNSEPCRQNRKLMRQSGLKITSNERFAIFKNLIFNCSGGHSALFCRSMERDACSGRSQVKSFSNGDGGRHNMCKPHSSSDLQVSAQRLSVFKRTVESLNRGGCS